MSEKIDLLVEAANEELRKAQMALRMNREAEASWQATIAGINRKLEQLHGKSPVDIAFQELREANEELNIEQAAMGRQSRRVAEAEQKVSRCQARYNKLLVQSRTERAGRAA